ncbi:uncharacterized protein [Leptinotarsa decemlineata]|uniref:uncharacterized protein n=1 Tax=Leptinotarsa decemlineata TaxID=7539 RepID=UPI003D304DF3
MVKAELTSVIKYHRDRYRQHVVDTIARAEDITILRLPPYHCELNPIELIWAQIKELAMERIRKEDWTYVVAHVIEEEEKMWRLDEMVDTVFDQIIIDLSVTGDSSSDESMDSETS